MTVVSTVDIFDDREDEREYESGLVRCENCGESWDEGTLGYEEAKAMIKNSRGQKCPACEDMPKEASKKQMSKAASKESVLKKSMEDNYDKVAEIVKRTLDFEEKIHHSLRGRSKDKDMIKMEVFSGLGIVYNVREMYKQSSFVDAVIDDVFEERGLSSVPKKTKAWF